MGSDLPELTADDFAYLTRVFFRPTDAARRTLPEDQAHGWWDSHTAIPRNRKNQRITVDGTSYRIAQTLETAKEYRDNELVEGIVWEVDFDPDPTAPAYRREPRPPYTPPRPPRTPRSF